MKTTKAKPFNGARPRPLTATAAQSPSNSPELARACQALFDEAVEVEGLEGPVALARVVGFVFFDWLPTIVDPDDFDAMRHFNGEMERLSHEKREDQT